MFSLQTKKVAMTFVFIAILCANIFAQITPYGRVSVIYGYTNEGGFRGQSGFYSYLGLDWVKQEGVVTAGTEEDLRIYTVSSGDTVVEIAQRLGISSDYLIQRNNLELSIDGIIIIHPGQTLVYSRESATRATQAIKNWTGRFELLMHDGNYPFLEQAYFGGSFDKLSVIFGLDNKGLNYFDDEIVGYREPIALALGVGPQLRFDLPNGLTVSALAPKWSSTYGAVSQSTNYLFPRLYAGTVLQVDNISIYPAIEMQMLQIDKNKAMQSHSLDSGTIMSFALASTVKMPLDQLDLAFHFNFGMNTEDMGYTALANRAFIDADLDPVTGAASSVKLKNATGFGFLFSGKYDLDIKTNIGAGFGYGSANTFYDSSSVAVNVLMERNIGPLLLRPYLSLNMETIGDNTSTLFSFGSQLRYDF